MKRILTLLLITLLLASLSNMLYATNIGNGSLSVTGTGWKSSATWINPSGYGNGYVLNLSSYNSGNPVALQGFVDLNSCAMPYASPHWANYYGKFEVWSQNGKTVQVVFATDNLGSWRGIPAQPWDRIRLENSMGLLQPEQWYCTEGGFTDDHVPPYHIYPTDQIYYFQLIMDASLKKFTLQAYGNGNGGGQDPPINSTPDKAWYEIGSIYAPDFDFNNVGIYARLWSSPEAATNENSTIRWSYMNLGNPLSMDQIPVPEPGTFLLLGCGLLGLAGLSRKKLFKK